MTDKEEIIIDGVDVSECAYFDYENEGTKECYAYSNECEANNCYFKQLARKTQECDTLKSQLDFEVQQKECIKQECEELKAQLNDMACMDDDNVLCYPRQELKKECERYKQALDEIAEHYEKVIKNLTTYDEVYDANISIEALHNISDIINKVKGE